MDYIGFVASFIMGITLGVMGGGGSILTVPILVYLFALSPSVATGYSLFIVGSTALIGSLIYIKKGDFVLKAGIPFAIMSIIGVNVSRAFIAPKIPEILVMALFAILMVSASYSMLRKKDIKTAQEVHSRWSLFYISLQGLIVGVIAGLVGAGGGFLIIPVLVSVAKLPMRKAIGTSLTIIALQSLFGFAGDLVRGMTVDWMLLGSITGFAIVGIAVGSMLSHKVNERNLKSAFGWFILVMGVTILLEQLRRF